MATLRLCSVPACGKKHHSNGYCRNHNARWRAHGDPEAGKAAHGEPMSWLMTHRGHTDEACLIWPFARDRKGYAKLQQGGAYRVMCEVAHGRPPSPEHEAAHSCGLGHEGCVNPRHLRWATRKDNSADRLAHGTDLRGAKSPTTSLKPMQVEEIRSLAGRMRQKDIAMRFGIGQSTVSRIQRGKVWQRGQDSP